MQQHQLPLHLKNLYLRIIPHFPFQDWTALEDILAGRFIIKDWLIFVDKLGLNDLHFI